MSEGSIKIGLSPCPNDIFIFGHLIEGLVPWKGPELEFEYLDIQALNEAVLSKSRKFDLIKCSYALFPKISRSFDIFPVGGALGKGVGPLLVGQAGVALSDRSVVYVPGFDTTAYCLFKKFGPRHLKAEALRYDLLMEKLCRDKTAMGVVIHESRFTYESLGLSLLLDLGKAWEDATQMPLPLGGPVVSRELSDSLKNDLAVAIRVSLESAWQNRAPIEGLLKQHAQEMDLEVMASHIDLYVNEYSLNLGESGLAAIEKLVEVNG